MSQDGPGDNQVTEPDKICVTTSNTSTATQSPLLRPKGSTSLLNKKLKLKPHLRRNGSIHSAQGQGHYNLVFSVDDDVNDDIIEEEEGNNTPNKNDKEYLEGYSDALRAMYKRKLTGSIDETSSIRLPIATASGRDSEIQDIPQLEAEISRPIEEFDNKNKVSVNQTDAIDIPDNASCSSSTSVDTLESLNLRERQDAINSTHPFGIKIWKPSLYKKKRSVATRAEEDIHDYELRKPTWKVFWGVQLCNFVWKYSFGLVLMLVCLFGAFIVFFFSGLGIHQSLRKYVRTFLKIGNYLRDPFGIFVILNKDKNYLEEDQLEGRSILEFQRWREQEEGRLFFNPPRRNTLANESRPLLKDHTGRPLNDQYLSLNSNAVDESANGDDDEDYDIKIRLFGRGSWSLGRFMFYIYFYAILQPFLYFLALLCWFFVFTIPMGKVLSSICDHLRRHPLALHFEAEKKYYALQGEEQFARKRKHQSIIMCTYRCCGWHYYKFTIDGTNIFFINLLVVVVFVIGDYFILKEKLELSYWFTESSFVFCACLFSVIPLAYFIGQAVASISAQSSMGVGAVINAFFSTVVEIFLYAVALQQGKSKLVEGSLIGSILGGVLLLPGLSMCGGALKRKTQRYNPRSAGVSSTMLLFAMVMMLAPSMLYQFYGTYEIQCTKCDTEDALGCSKCRFIQLNFRLDALYHNVIKPFSFIVAMALFTAYITGLYFTLRTHASLIWSTNSHEGLKKDDQPVRLRSPSLASLDFAKGKQKIQTASLGSSSVLDSNKKSKQQLVSTSQELANKRIPLKLSEPAKSSQAPKKSEPLNTSIIIEDEEESSGGHDAPNWSRSKSTVILLGATLLYAIIAEILVDTVDDVLKNFPINPKFLGLTVFALVPNTTEFLNAISFAVGGNVALSMEIGSAYALQVVLIQIPSLVVYCMYMRFDQVEKIFTLVFPRWDTIATLIAILLFIYLYAEGKSNYFKGIILILSYLVILIGFWLNDTIEYLNKGDSVVLLPSLGPTSLEFRLSPQPL